jgi:hypothetical protein
MVILPDDAEYGGARSIWNAMIDKRPGVIVRCSGVADVMHAMRVANSERLLVSVRRGGHNIAGNALCDGGLTVDLSGMKSVRINPDAQRAYVEPGATLGPCSCRPRRCALPIGRPCASAARVEQRHPRWGSPGDMGTR